MVETRIGFGGGEVLQAESRYGELRDREDEDERTRREKEEDDERELMA
jgi:hypothetical protein